MALTTGRILKLPYGIREIEWIINDYFTANPENIYYRFDSPTFSFADVDATWHFRLYPRSRNEDKFVGLYLYRDERKNYAVEYTFGLRKCDGNVVQLTRGILKTGQTYSDAIKFIEKEELLYRKSELVPNNTLTIICTMKFMTDTTHSSQKIVLDEARPSKLPRLDKLSVDFKDLFADKETCDVTLSVQNKEYKAHRTVLMARSRVFAATFKHDTLERQTGVITISDCDADSFQLFLDYLYSGEFQQLSFHSAINLYYTSDKYGVEELKEFCVEYLIQHLAVENVCEIVSFADKHDGKKLFSAAQDFFNENVKSVFVTSEWKSFLKNDHRLASQLLIEMSKVKL